MEDNVKIVTLRSTYLVVNLTFYPLEVMLVDHTGHPVYSLEKIGQSLLISSSRCTHDYKAPGQDYALPIEAVTQNRIKLQPDREYDTFDIQ